MADFVFTADWHLGKSWPFKIDPPTGVSRRVEDVVENVRKVVAHTIDRGVPLLLVGGDVFEHTHVRPYFRELVRSDVIEPLVEHGIKVMMLAGNHDQPRNTVRGTSLDDFRGYSGVTVVKDKARVEEIETAEGEARLILLPYLHPEILANMVTEDGGLPADIRDRVATMRHGELFSFGRSMLADYLDKRTGEAASDGVPALVVGHYFVEAENIRISSISNPRAPPGEFSLPPGVIPQNMPLTLMGHVHLHQELRLAGERSIVYCGSPERLTWNEFKDEKGFITVDAGDRPSWEFHALPCRPMVSPRIVVPDGADPTGYVLANLPETRNALVRLDVEFPQGGRMMLRDDEIDRALERALHYEMKWKERSDDEGGSADFDLSPTRLFMEYLDMNYHDHPLREELQRVGEDVLQEVLG